MQYLQLDLSRECDSKHVLDYDDLAMAILPVNMEFIESNTENVYATVDIIIHPAFQVLCPYIRCWNQNGGFLSTEELQSLLDQFYHRSDEPAMIMSENSVTHPFGRLISEEHPFTGLPCSTIHVCGLISEHSRPRISLPSWLSVIGPFIGLHISSKDFISMSKLLVS